MVTATGFTQEGSSLRYVASKDLPSKSLEFINTYFANAPITTAHEKNGNYTVVLSNDPIVKTVEKTHELNNGTYHTFTVNVREPKETALRTTETSRGTDTYTVAVRDNITITFNSDGEWKKVTTSGSSLDTIAFLDPSIPSELKSLYNESGVTSILRGKSAVFGDGTKVSFIKGELKKS